ncbi:hypothetical protein Hanom_Chr16g01474851 [Helianthus anomalus]
MNARTKRKGTNVGKIGDISVKYRIRIADDIGTDIPTDILHGDRLSIYHQYITDINCID